MVFLAAYGPMWPEGQAELRLVRAARSKPAQKPSGADLVRDA